MSTSSKVRASIRQGGPGASHENAKAPLKVPKPAAASHRQHSAVSGGCGEHDTHRTHNSGRKGGGARST
jgi:hypothetical protein